MFVTRNRVVLALILGLAAPGPARADNLDAALVREVWRVHTFLTENKVKNVGVLNFSVQKGKGSESFNLGTLSTSLPARLEPALVITNDPKTPIGVIKDANAVATKHKIAWFSKPADREKLFAHADYPLAWGTARVKPDALLVGKIKVSDDLAKLTVTIEAITADAPTKLKPVSTFDVKTDRDLLRELGQSYAVPRDLAKTRAERDKQAVGDARRRDLNPGSDLSPDNIAGIKFRVLYDGAAQTISADDRSPGEWRVNPPTAGQKVGLEIGNNGQLKEKLGVTLRVNGRSVWRQSQGPDNDPDTGIWLMEPDKLAFAFEGFFMSPKGENLIPFRVLSEAESAAREAEFGERVGTFDVDVFASRPGESDGEVLSISRSLNRSAKPPAPAKSNEELRTQLLDQNPLLRKMLSAPRKGGLVDADEKAMTGPEVPSGLLNDRQRIGRLTVRYYDPKGSGALQISK
jgi:hypothetical protein